MGSLQLINEAVYEKGKLFQTRLYIICSKIYNSPYNLFFATKFNNSSILVTIISWDYWICRWRMNMLVTTKYQPRLSSMTILFLQADLSIRLQYVHQIKLYTIGVIQVHERIKTMTFSNYNFKLHFSTEAINTARIIPSAINNNALNFNS